jgi:hypothetical protein
MPVFRLLGFYLENKLYFKENIFSRRQQSSEHIIHYGVQNVTDGTHFAYKQTLHEPWGVGLQ